MIQTQRVIRVESRVASHNVRVPKRDSSRESRVHSSVKLALIINLTLDYTTVLHVLNLSYLDIYLIARVNALHEARPI